MEEAFREIEEKDGIRLTWNLWPAGPMTTDALQVPIACLYTPRKNGAPVLDYEPINCSGCRSILNPYCTIDFDRKEWRCALCDKRSILPSHYQDITPDMLPAELYEHNTTVEYVLATEAESDPIFFFVIDTCTFDEERHQLLCDALVATLDTLPDNSIIGYLHYGTNIELTEEGRLTEINSENRIRKTYLFSGKKIYTKETFLGGSKNAILDPSKFFVRKSDALREIFQAMPRDSFPVMDGNRQVRCTGSALSLAAALLESRYNKTGVKILLFTQGPCTYGPGTIASLNLIHEIRSPDKTNSLYTKSAKEFYTTLAQRMATNNYSCDIIAATLNDVGIYEMRVLTDLTSGMIIMAQDFDKEIYTTSCRKNVSCEEGVLDQGLNANITVVTSKNLSFLGIRGQGSKVEGGWKMGSITLGQCVVAEFIPKEGVNGQMGFIQIITRYQRSDRKIRQRVTTFGRMFCEQEKIVSGFDQEAACVYQTRSFMDQAEGEMDIDLVRRVDRTLIRFLKKYATYQREDPGSLIIPESMSYYPNFMYFLRRSTLIQTLTSSPDETAYFRNLVCRLATTEAMTMIVPTLLMYDCEGGVSPVEMDGKSLRDDVVLLLDTFHNVLVWRGSDVVEWLAQGYEKEYPGIALAVTEAEKRGQELVNARLPTPQFVVCDRFGSQERILLSRVNPCPTAGVVTTDDIDFDSFYNCLAKIVVGK
ncbi:Protein transport protein SEC23 [Astathelohania contejeani]|uniref:Protein transport protein SEC23 n=1 Tax=Astathelohania contejeani TaxID=164912 RepID=A0ABQ7I280_9MICR|nr:Protein transport protein SEC23 [Thelohania contejeani]